MAERILVPFAVHFAAMGAKASSPMPSSRMRVGMPISRKYASKARMPFSAFSSSLPSRMSQTASASRANRAT